MTPTLDPERTDRLRTFLVVEAASSAAAATPARRSPAVRRSLAAGAAGAVLVAGGLVVASASAGDGPARPGPAAEGRAAPSSEATPSTALDLETIALTRADGWTTVSLTDIDADPDAVVADLQAAGFTVERRSLAVVDDGAGGRWVEVEGGDGDDPQVAGIVTAASGGVVGLSATLPEGELLASLDDSDSLVRFGEDGSVSIRDGADVTLLVLTEP